MTDEEAFQAKLDADPTDWVTRLVFADWLEERGDERAEGIRALAAIRKRPFVNSSYCSIGGDKHWNHTDMDWWMKNKDWLFPHDWFLAVPFVEEDDGHKPARQIWKRSKTRRELEDRIALAWLLLSPERRAELLAQAERALT